MTRTLQEHRRQPPVRSRAGLRSHAIVLSLTTLLAWSAAVPSALADSSSSPALAAPASHMDAEMTDAELERRLAPLRADDAEARHAAARSLDHLEPNAIGAITRQLDLQRKAASSSVVAAVDVARNVAGKTPEHDLCDALLKTTSEDLGYTTAVTTAALLRALAHIGTTPALRELVKVAGDHQGAFRTEVERHVKALGDKAVPALIETRRNSPPALRHWAVAQLEGMGKRIPGDAVLTKDNQVLSDVLRAFANVHDVDALPVILSFVNSDRIRVRTAARDAIDQFGPDAIWKTREAYTNVTGKPAPESWQAAQIAKALFAAYDRLRLQEVHELLDEGLAKEKEGNLEEAVNAFDKVLARQPMIERRGEMLSAYIAYAEKLEDRDPMKALAVFRRAARLWPESSRATHIEAEIAYLEGKELLARGIADVEPFKRALTLDPGNTNARAELTRLQTKVEEREERLRLIAAGVTAVLVALIGLILVVGGRPRQRASRR